MQHLFNNLTAAGIPPQPLTSPDGSRLLVLPFGGRLIGLFPPGSDDNFLWTHPALAAADSATAWRQRPGWLNLGGDRTWLAPEIKLFISDLAHPGESYAVPSALDPGNWTLSSAAAAEVCLTCDSHLQLHRTGRLVGVRLGKSFQPAHNPLAGTPLDSAGLQYAGYTQVTTLELAPGTGDAIRFGIWNLLQLPQPGEMLITTRGEAAPQVVFGKLTAGELTVAPRQVRWQMGNRGGDAKIAIKAAALTGRAGHLRQTQDAGISDLVVREFAVDPAGDYVDALWEAPHETGWAFQACGVRSGTEQFNELEYHAPAVHQSRDESRVWAFRGSESAIREAAGLLLGCVE